MPDLYGGFALRRGDDDATRRWGDMVRPPEEAGSGDHVATLRKDLTELGYFLAKATSIANSGQFDIWLEEAVREFQVMARLPTVAIEGTTPADDNKYLLRLKPVDVPLAQRYPQSSSGANERLASGVVNSRTRTLIAHWIAQRWRCPWVIAEWAVPSKTKPKKSLKPKAAPPPPTPGNPIKVGLRTLKRHDLSYAGRGAKVSGEVFLHDFSGTYFPWLGREHSDHPEIPNPRMYLGMELGFQGRRGPGGRPGLPDIKPFLIEISPENLGVDIGTPDSPAASTFRVVGAVASIEASDGLQLTNAYDKAGISCGLFHFAMVAPIKDDLVNVGKGELSGLLSWLYERHPEEFSDRIGEFGLRPVDAWGADGAALLNPRNGIWTSFSCRESEAAAKGAVVDTAAAAQMLQSWQWTARFTLLPFVSPSYRMANWAFARMRLARIVGLAIGGTFPDEWTLGQVFSSELNVAKLLRIHVHGSGRLALLENAGGPPQSAPWIRAVLEKILTPAEITQGPAHWGNGVQQRLGVAIDLKWKRYSLPHLDRNGRQVPGDFVRIGGWKHDARGLSAEARSFKLDSNGL
jgi:hypothetical protein